jgi:uncharacterized phage protein (TIGR01671 family)
MREIRFRGKRADNGEWTYGYAVFEGEQAFIIMGGRLYPDIGIDRSVLAFTNWCEVIPETVGQFTDLCDKNGVGIYGGDIYQLPVIERERRDEKGMAKAVVEWNENRGCWTGKYKDGGRLGFSLAYGLEVIGNIHDNPELLKCAPS